MEACCQLVGVLLTAQIATSEGWGDRGELGTDPDGGKRRHQAMGGGVFMDSNDARALGRMGLSWFVGWGGGHITARG